MTKGELGKQLPVRSSHMKWKRRSDIKYNRSKKQKQNGDNVELCSSAF